MHKKRTHSKMLIEEIQVEHNAVFENIMHQMATFCFTSIPFFFKENLGFWFGILRAFKSLTIDLLQF